MKYPVRCKIIDVDGQNIQVGPHIARTPKASKPHIGKDGTADRINGRVRIDLDDGGHIFGDECWWEPLN